MATSGFARMPAARLRCSCLLALADMGEFGNSLHCRLARMTHRTVFFISDGTGITAETFGNAILAQFDMKTRQIRLPFTDTVGAGRHPGRLQGHAAGHVRHLRAPTGK